VSKYFQIVLTQKCFKTWLSNQHWIKKKYVIVAYLSLGMYRHRSDVFWNSEVGRAAMTQHLENMKPNKEGQVGGAEEGG